MLFLSVLNQKLVNEFSFIYSFIHSSVHPSIHPFIQSFIFFIHSFVHSFICSFIHSFTHSLTHSLTHLLIHPSIHPSIYPSIHSFIHSYIHPFIDPSFIHSSSMLFTWLWLLSCIYHTRLYVTHKLHVSNKKHNGVLQNWCAIRTRNVRTKESATKITRNIRSSAPVGLVLRANPVNTVSWHLAFLP